MWPDSKSSVVIRSDTPFTLEHYLWYSEMSGCGYPSYISGLYRPSSLSGSTVIDLTQIGVLLEHIIALVPLGILGLIRWGMWLAKRIPALFYRPIENNFDIDATIITPVY